MEGMEGHDGGETRLLSKCNENWLVHEVRCPSRSSPLLTHSLRKSRLLFLAMVRSKGLIYRHFLSFSETTFLDEIIRLEFTRRGRRRKRKPRSYYNPMLFFTGVLEDRLDLHHCFMISQISVIVYRETCRICECFNR